MPSRPPRVFLRFLAHYFVSTTMFLGLLLLVTHLSHCTPSQRQVARDVLSVTQVACVIVHASEAESDVAKACALAEPFVEPLRDALAQARKSRAPHCGGDAGP
jgi:hypothetical protein